MKNEVSEDSGYLSNIVGVTNDSSLTTISLFDNTETGNIWVKAIVGNTELTANSTILSSIEDVYGVKLNNMNEVKTFSNAGSISVFSKIGNIINSKNDEEINDTVSNSFIAGTYINGNLNSFSNSGSINVSAVIGDIINSGEEGGIDGLVGNIVAGTHIEGDSNSFSNSGSINVSAVIGDITNSGENGGINGEVGNIEVDGFSANGNVGSFFNSGSINVSAVIGDITNSGDDGGIASLGNEFVDGFSANGNVGSFFNSGSINVSAVIGDITNSGEDGFVGFIGNSNILLKYTTIIPGIYGVYIDGDSNSFSNSGSINVSAVIGDITNSGDGGDMRLIGNNVFSIYKSRVVPFISGVYIGGDSNSFSNSGSINVSAVMGNITNNGEDGEIDGAGNFNILGTYIGGDSNSFSNSGSINVSAVMGNITNNGEDGEIYTSNDGIYGVRTYDTGSFSNHGNIKVLSTVGNVINNGKNGSIEAIGNGYDFGSPPTPEDGIYGVCVNDVTNSFSNSGSIVVSSNIGNIINNGEDSVIEGVGNTGIYGVYIDEDANSFSNSGSISVSSNIGDIVNNGKNSKIAFIGNSSNYGVYIGETANSFSNSGSISVSSNIGDIVNNGEDKDIGYVGDMDIYGVYIDGNVNLFSNSGYINVTSRIGKTKNATTIQHNIFGVRINHNSSSKFINSGVISTNIVAKGENALIDKVGGVYIDPSDIYLYNTGLISLYVNSDSPYVQNAAALYLEDSDITLNSPGEIVANGNSKVRDIYINNSNVVIDKNLGLGFNGDPSKWNKPVYLCNNSKLNLNSAKLLAYLGRDVYIGKPYYIIETDSTSSVSGKFSSLAYASLNPDFSVSWYGNDRSSNAAVMFKYTPKGSTSAMGIQSAYLMSAMSLDYFSDFVMNKIVMPYEGHRYLSQNSNVMLASSGMIKTDGVYSTPFSSYNNGLFVLPFYSKMHAKSLGYDSDIVGLQVGYIRKLNSAFDIGTFVGYGDSGVDFKGSYSMDSESQDIFNVGLFGTYNKDNYYLSLFTTYSYVSHAYQGKTGPDLEMDESSDYHSKAYNVKTLGGYSFELKDNIRITPMIGLTYTHWHTPSHSTKADYSKWDKHYENFSKNFWVGTARVNLSKKWQLKDSNLIAFLGLGVDRFLNNNDIVIGQSIPGINTPVVDVKKKMNRTIGRANVGLDLVKGNASFELTFSSEFNGDYKLYTGYANLGWRF
ncbi:autotransporter domain-containing protein [Hippea alviniae]|uniref:autotransporter domain-containing protein n=1 Tax=Hippea alviniae TaxID=1279027 RepID=UPI00041F3EF1|nr:autotransporter domain-containing protein [Hippea alviniae]